MEPFDVAYVWLLIFAGMAVTAGITAWAIASIIREERRDR